jgi:hypothetical protein
LPAADLKTPPSLLRLAAIQGIKREKRLTDPAPQGCLVSTEPIEREVGQIGETKEATRKLKGRSNGRTVRVVWDAPIRTVRRATAAEWGVACVM